MKQEFGRISTNALIFLFVYQILALVVALGVSVNISDKAAYLTLNFLIVIGLLLIVAGYVTTVIAKLGLSKQEVSSD